MPLRVLQVEDSESDAEMIVRVLQRAGYEVLAQRVEDPVEMREALEYQAWDVIIADYSLPGFDAPAALNMVREMGRDTPFLVVSGVIGEEVAVRMMKAGAHDYIMKGNLTRLPPAVARETREFRNRQELAHQSRVLERQAKLLNLSRDAIITANDNRVIETWNLGAEEVYGWAESEAVGQAMHSLLETRGVATTPEVDAELRLKGHWEGELVHTRRDKQPIVVESRQVLVRDSGGLPVGILEIDRDVTERKQIEGRLREKQKAETMGALASGLAHNFNNLLTVVLGNINLALRESAGGEVREYLRDAFESAQSAAKLTRQMLAYAGKGAVARVPTSASEVAQKTVQLVRASLPENIEFRTELAPNLPSLLTDPRQLQQVLTNLLLNAAESFGPAQGGTVTLRAEWRHERLCLSVSDTGCGMDAVTQSRIFDPFFSTKALGRGLGLPAAQGIVRSLGGEIHIESSVGRGTCVTVLLPAAPTPVVAPEPAPAAPLSPRQVAKQDQAATLDQVP